MEKKFSFYYIIYLNFIFSFFHSFKNRNIYLSDFNFIIYFYILTTENGFLFFSAFNIIIFFFKCNILFQEQKKILFSILFYLVQH